MKNLIKRIGRWALPLVVPGLIGCATIPSLPKDAESQDNKPVPVIDLGDGYTAESPKAAQNLDLATSSIVGEVYLERTSEGMVIHKTRYQSPPREWLTVYKVIRDLVDGDNNTIVTNSEIEGFLYLRN